MCNVAYFIGIFSTAVTIYTCIQKAGGACIRNTSGLSQKYISEVNLPKHIKPFTESHFPVKPLFYPFSDNIKIGMKFRNINLHCLACIIISFHYEKKNSNTIFSYFNFLILSESASSETLGRFRSSYRR